MKIYTKGGDKGKTSLLSGERVSKNHIRIDAYGCIDELNSFIGMLISENPAQEHRTFLSKIQNSLFIVGAQLSLQKTVSFNVPDLQAEIIKQTEDEIDRMNEYLPPLKQFILPGGCKAASVAHVCRSVCRRAERLIIGIPDDEKISRRIIPFINRLSDYFFVLARSLNFENKYPEIIRNK